MYRYIYLYFVSFIQGITIKTIAVCLLFIYMNVVGFFLVIQFAPTLKLTAIINYEKKV
jgi:hypothetical protein